ncbi:Acidic repeat-containing protein [Papilio xuthus]|uniref:Acidic repeat-containing protein n=1 Tax=Papilio xuthus TaxID=66420 RepID=A0A194Q515_PAPXU|nr:Acidic repeat-containing protein [Papilio xuthus]
MSTPLKESRPSFDGWSPGQNIVCATPKQETIPSTPKDIANESLEECSIKKIQQSQKKLLDDLYGDAWKSIPSLLKTLKKEKHNIIPKKLFDDDADNIISEKASTRKELKQNKLLYLTDSEKKVNKELNNTDKKGKKKLYTEVIPSTPEPKAKKKEKNVNSTTKKLKGLSVTELVQVMNNDVDNLTKKVENISVTKKVENVCTPSKELTVNRLSFLASLADNVPSWRCHPEAIQYRDNYKTLREQLTRRLFLDFNKVVFDNVLDADLPIIWDTKLRSTAGTTTNRLLKTARGDRIRTSSVKLSIKVVDSPQRLRDTLVHELCHAATWLIDGELRAGHGPLWKKCIKRHSKSIDVTKKCCGYCHGAFEIIVNRKNKDGVVVSTPARKAGPNGFALYVKENYGTLKDGTKSHAEVMKLLGEQFSAKKKNNEDFDI